MWGRKNVPVVFFGAFPSFNKGFFSFSGTSFCYVQFSFLWLQGIYTATELLGKYRAGDKIQYNEIKLVSLEKLAGVLNCEYLACFDHKFTVLSDFMSISEVSRIYSSPSYPFCRCYCLKSYKGYNKPLLMRFLGPHLADNLCYYLFGSKLCQWELLFTK